MRLLIDALGAPSASGGMRLYAEELVYAWAEAFPEDELWVVGYAWCTQAFAGSTVRVIPLPESAPARIAGQLAGTALLAAGTRPDAVLSLSLVVTPLFPAARRFVVVHDWRHLKNPGEFSLAQRLYRRLWVWSTNHAACAIQISDKTSQESALFAPEARRVVVENGRDHARRWQRVTLDPSAPRSVITFGHQTNKRPELVLDAFARASTQREEPMVLTILGARGEYAKALAKRAAALGVGSRVVLPGFVSGADYQALIQRASVVVLASTDEGFGLPVAEAQFFGVPALGTTDSGLDRIHQGLLVVEPSVDGLSDGLQRCLTHLSGAPVTPRQRWCDTAAGIRAAISARLQVR